MTRTTILMISYIFMCSMMPALLALPDNPAHNPPEPMNDAGGVPYGGVVTEIAKYSITVQFAKDKPKRFSVSETLAVGKVPMFPRPIPGRRQPYTLMPSYMYRLTDVKVGDWVGIKYSSLDGVITCDHIRISKRPGGRVPPLPDEAEALRRPRARPPGFPAARTFIRYDEDMNAYWDLEDKGIPYPEKFGKNRRFPEAPMPRAVPERRPIQ
jgi:hypothetical protein